MSLDWFPWYPLAFRKKTRHLFLAEDGAYTASKVDNKKWYDAIVKNRSRLDKVHERLLIKQFVDMRKARKDVTEAPR